MKMDGYWVYTHTTPDGFVYVGMSMQKNTYDRWRKSHYKNLSLGPYIEKWGWDNISHIVVKYGLTKDEALKLEDELIRKYKKLCLCINQRCSGGLLCGDERKTYYNKNKKHFSDWSKNYYQLHKEEIKKKVKQYRDEHRDKINAKQRAKHAAKKQKPYTYGDPLF